MMVCPACGSTLAVGSRHWHLRCASCHYEGSTLTPRILEQVAGGDLDEAAREHGLTHLRQANFERLLAWLLLQMPATGSTPQLLDVGCAHGWFIECAASRFNVTGVEPDPDVAAATRARGLTVRSGFFPDALAPSECFDVIVFNDVLEHIPNVNATLVACWQHLAPGGCVIVNAPSSRGFLYRLSVLLARVGLSGAFDRMWQRGFPSPHVHYFATANLTLLAHQVGFELGARSRLPAVTVRGLYARIRYARDVPVIKALLLTAAITLLAPLLAVLPPDIEVWCLRRPQ